MQDKVTGVARTYHWLRNRLGYFVNSVTATCIENLKILLESKFVIFKYDLNNSQVTRVIFQLQLHRCSTLKSEFTSSF